MAKALFKRRFYNVEAALREELPKTPPPELIDWSEISPGPKAEGMLDGKQKNGDESTPLCVFPVGVGKLRWQSSRSEAIRRKARRVRLFTSKPAEPVKPADQPTWDFKSYKRLFERLACTSSQQSPSTHPYVRPSMMRTPERSNQFSIDEILGLRGAAGEQERPLDMRTNFGDQENDADTNETS